MGADDFVGVQPDAGGKSIDAEKTATGAGVVYRQRIVLDGAKFDALMETMERMLAELQCIRVILNEGFQTDINPEEIGQQEREIT